MTRVQSDTIEGFRALMIPGAYYLVRPLPPYAPTDHTLMRFEGFGSFNGQTLKFVVLAAPVSMRLRHRNGFPVPQFYREIDFVSGDEDVCSPDYHLFRVDPLELPLYAGEGFLTPEYREALACLRYTG